MAHAMLRARRAPGRGDDRGAVAVEFALIVPILVLLVFGIISYGYMLSFRQAVSQAAAEGARAAAISASSTSDAQRAAAARAAITDALGSYGVTCTGSGVGSSALTRSGEGNVGSCTVERTSCEGNSCFKVTIAYDYEDHPLLPSLYTDVVLPDTLTYSTEVRVS